MLRPSSVSSPFPARPVVSRIALPDPDHYNYDYAGTSGFEVIGKEG
jgi:hypothetical protein